MSVMEVVETPRPVIELVEQTTSVVEIYTAPPGPKGDPGGFGVVAFEYYQGPASTAWAIPHGLGFYPNVTVIDSAGTPVDGVPEYVDRDNLTMHFNNAFGGTAYLS